MTEVTFFRLDCTKPRWTLLTDSEYLFDWPQEMKTDSYGLLYLSWDMAQLDRDDSLTVDGHLTAGFFHTNLLSPT